MATGLHLAFGQYGNGLSYLLGGWAHDGGRSWTVGHESQLLLPRPRKPGTYLLKITGSPFIAPSVPCQRLFVVVNGTEVGRYVLDAAFKIECVVPQELLAGTEDVLVTFRHPDAVRPSSVSKSTDPRWVAVSLQKLAFGPAPSRVSATKSPSPDAGLAAALSPLRQPVVLPTDAIPFRQTDLDWCSRALFLHFNDTVARHPHEVAIEDERRTYTYVDVIQHAAQIGTVIAEATQPGALVAICVGDSFWFPIAVLGCLAKGRTCMLLDPRVEGAGVDGNPASMPELQILSASMRPVLAGVPFVTLPAEMPPAPGVAGLSVEPMQETAFVLRSPVLKSRRKSGGWVEIKEAAMLADIANYIETAHLNDRDRHLSLVSFASLDGLRVVLAAMLTGSRLSIVDRPSADGADVLATMRRTAVTACTGPLPALLSLARQPEAYWSFRTLRLIRIDGGLLHWNQIASLRPLLPETCHILYAYGSEETLACLQDFVVMPHAGAGDTVPAGFAVPGFTLTVVAKDGTAAPDGAVGELMVAGVHIAGRVRTGQRVRRHAGGLYELVHDVEPIARADVRRSAAARRPPGGAVEAAWQAVLGVPPRPDDVFGECGGDSLKLIELVVELENRLGRRLPMSLLTLQMNAQQIATALQSPEHPSETARSLLAHELVQRFESLGGYCEFGFAQRACHVEPYSLLRFAGTRPAGLVSALENRFAGFGDPDTLRVEIKPNNEFVIYDDRYYFAFHTGMLSHRSDPESLLMHESTRLRFLARRMCEDLSAARKIYIYRSHGPEEDDAVMAVHGALLRNGPNRLMWVMSADAEHRVGSTRPVSDSLMLGYVDPDAVIDSGQTVRVESWLQVCAAAHRHFGQRL